MARTTPHVYNRNITISAIPNENKIISFYPFTKSDKSTKIC